MPSLLLGCVSYFRAILRLGAFLLYRRFRAFFLVGISFDRTLSSDFVFFCHIAEFLLSHNRDQFFSQLCVIFQYFFCACSIFPWHVATTSACFHNLIQSIAKKSLLLNNAAIYPLVVVLCFACQLSRTYLRLFLEGGHSYIVDTLLL